MLLSDCSCQENLLQEARDKALSSHPVAEHKEAE